MILSLLFGNMAFLVDMGIFVFFGLRTTRPYKTQVTMSILLREYKAQRSKVNINLILLILFNQLKKNYQSKLDFLEG